jgi:carboxymethylenebutenolidase
MKRRNLLIASAGFTSASLITASSQPGNATREPLGATIALSQNLRGYFVSPPGKGPYPATVVIMEAFGLNENIKKVCNRLAQAGYAALAPDFYHGDVFAYTNLQGAIAKLKTMNDDKVMAEFGTGLDYLKTRQEVMPDQVATIGFCMGGRLAFLANAVHHDKLKAAVCFYGSGIAAEPDPFGRPALLDKVAAMQAPIMLLYGTEDQFIVAGEHQRITLALSSQKKRYTLAVFDQAGHGFMSDRRDSYAPKAAEEAWDMTLSFCKWHLQQSR